MVVVFLLLSVVYPFLSRSLLSKKTSINSQASAPKTNRSIIGGEKATENEFPYFVRLSIPSKLLNMTIYDYCGGSLISEDYILTAAHCFDRFDKDAGAINILIGVTSYSGVYSGHYIGVVDDSKIIIHEKYFGYPDKDKDANILRYDIALIKLEAKASGVPTVSIPNIYVDRNGDGYRPKYDNPENIYKEATLMGIGTTSNVKAYTNYLKKTTMQIGYLTGDAITFNDRINRSSTGPGDSGGPAILKDSKYRNKTIVIGVVRQGAFPVPTSGPLVWYTSVSKYADWIKENSGVGSNQGTVDIMPSPTTHPLTSICATIQDKSTCQKYELCKWGIWGSCRKK